MSMPATWNPRIDPCFRDVWLAHLVGHRDEWVHPADVFDCGDDWQRTVLRQVAYETVVAARRLGHEIDGDRSLGYCYRGAHLVAYLHIRDGEPTCDDGQLTMDELEGVVSAP